MSHYKQIPGVETRFTSSEIQTLIDHFNCKTNRDLRLAALRYESLFFYFSYEYNGFEPRPYDRESHMLLALALAESLFSNFRDAERGLMARHPGPRPPGRKKHPPFPDDIEDKLAEARKHGRTKLQAVKWLIDTKIIDYPGNAEPKSVLRQIEKHIQEKNRRYAELMEDFKDVALPID